MPGVETSLAAMLTAAAQGKCTLAQVSRWMSGNVAKGYKIPHKGELRVGWDADLILVDCKNYRPVLAAEVLSKCGWNPFEGESFTSWTQVTIVGGEIAYADGKVNPEVRGKALSFDGEGD